MSDPVKIRQSKNSPEWLQMTKAERRAAAKAAAAQAARRQRLRQRLTLAAVTVATLVVIAVIAILVYPHVKGSGTASPGSAQGTATPTANPGFPPLPPGADPALATKPRATAGTGDVTQLKTTTLIEGTGAAAEVGQQITVNYVGVSYRSGEEFDASWNRSQAYPFQLGGGNVIKGWDQGLVGVKVGSRVQLDIPAGLAYGDHPSDGRPAGPLRFIVDVLAVQ